MTDEKWKARARELVMKLGLDWTDPLVVQQAAQHVAAALAEAYTEGRDDEWGRTERVD